MRETGHLVDFFTDRHAVDKILEVNDTRVLGQDREGIRIPLGEFMSLFHALSVDNLDGSAVHNLVAAGLATTLVAADAVADAGHRRQSCFPVLVGWQLL